MSSEAAPPSGCPVKHDMAPGCPVKHSGHDSGSFQPHQLSFFAPFSSILMFPTTLLQLPPQPSCPLTAGLLPFPTPAPCHPLPLPLL